MDGVTNKSTAVEMAIAIIIMRFIIYPRYFNYLPVNGHQACA